MAFASFFSAYLEQNFRRKNLEKVSRRKNLNTLELRIELLVRQYYLNMCWRLTCPH
jgi:hypothetical protein